MVRYLVRQDGAQFYLYDNGSGLITIISYPHKVRDFDVTRADQARNWFRDLMGFWNVVFYFEGE